MQGPNENILLTSASSKLFTVKGKLKIWEKHAQKNQFEVVPSLSISMTQESFEVMALCRSVPVKTSCENPFQTVAKAVENE